MDASCEITGWRVTGENDAHLTIKFSRFQAVL